MIAGIVCPIINDVCQRLGSEDIRGRILEPHQYLAEKILDGSQLQDELPQEWPEHLDAEATVQPVNRLFPRGEFVLDFTAMPAASFEQFCWWLLSKEQTLRGCQRVGRNGSKQDGIDLFAYDERFANKLNIYECKAWKKFDATRLTEAIDSFLQRGWSGAASSFTLILAQPDLGNLAGRWHVERQRLRAAGIEGELWTALHLTQKIQAHPDLLSKFFPGAQAEAFGNLWMERTGFVDLVSKAVFDPRKRVARKAREVIEQSGGLTDNILRDDDISVGQAETHDRSMLGPSSRVIDTYRTISHNGRHWFYKGPWFSVSLFLPDYTSASASAAFDFHQDNLRGVTLTVSHEWLLKSFLFSSEAPLSSEGRSFIVGKMPGETHQYLINLPNCRLTLEEKVVQELAGVADLMTKVMRDALMALEGTWSAVDFPFLDWGGSHKVAMASLRKDVWREIGRFTEEHDYASGSSPWHIFDGHSEFLKPFHQKPVGIYEDGYHALIYASKAGDFFSEDSVTLLWAPDTLTYRSPSPSGWWSCEYAFHWLNDTLLPEVKRRVFLREYGSWWLRFWHAKDAKRFLHYLDEIFVVRDLRQPALLHDGGWTTGIVQSVEALRAFFTSVSVDSVRPYIRRQEVENLHRAVALIAGHNRGFPGYVASSLSLDKRPSSHAELIEMIHQRIESGAVVSSCHVVDYVFRAMLELLGDADDFLCLSDREAVQLWMLPFARVRDDGLLVRRHTKRA